MGEIGDGIAFHLEIDRDRRAAQLGVRGRGRIRLRQPADPGDIAGELENSAIVDVVEHGCPAFPSAKCASIVSGAPVII